MQKMTDRAEIAQAAHDRFAGRPFSWGDRDCAQLAKFVVMRAGHPNPLKGAQDYAGEVGAVRALRHALKTVGKPADGTLADVLDGLGYVRLPAPAFALPGDLIGMQGTAPFGFALAVSMGNGKALAFAIDPESGEGVGFVGDALITRDGITPAAAAWSLF